jgi:hypothetical protein
MEPTIWSSHGRTPKAARLLIAPTVALALMSRKNNALATAFFFVDIAFSLQ